MKKLRELIPWEFRDLPKGEYPVVISMIGMLFFGAVTIGLALWVTYMEYHCC